MRLKISSKISVATKMLQQKSWYFVAAVEMYFSMYLNHQLLKTSLSLLAMLNMPVEHSSK